MFFYHFFIFMFIISSVIYFFFFFQAEDGIRDTSVTGVQTCALPIFGRALSGERRMEFRLEAEGCAGERFRLKAELHAKHRSPLSSDSSSALTAKAKRSEERRVGKECRSRWSQYD